MCLCNLTLKCAAFFLRFKSSHYEAKQALHALKLRAEYELFPASLQVGQACDGSFFATLRVICILIPVSAGSTSFEEDS